MSSPTTRTGRRRLPPSAQSGRQRTIPSTRSQLAPAVRERPRALRRAWGFLLLWLATGWLFPPGQAGTVLGLQGTRFTVNDQPRFLLGASYYAGLGATPEFLRQDLDDLGRHGFNWIRVWATWAAFTNDVSAVDGSGHAREPFLGRLRDLVAECDRRSLIVDVSLSRGNGVTGPARLGDLERHRRAVETLVTALRPYRNWYLDLANERSIRDVRYVSFEELRALRDAAKALDPGRLITASHAGGDLEREDVRQYLVDAGLDFLAPHRPRQPGSAGQTERHTRELLAWMRELGREAPVHYQEPFRRGYGGWQPAAADFNTDLGGARKGGAAGWCWHNGDFRNRPDGEPRHSFDLRTRRLFDQLDAEEQAFLQSLREALPAPSRASGPQPWPAADPAAVGLDAAALRTFSDFVRGRGCVVRQGKLVYTWGDISTPGDVASAAKPVFAHFLWRALETERISSLDEPVVSCEPRLRDLNPDSGHKDRDITWRHLATQTSCYGLVERPGTAFAYNDWSMALFIDLLFAGVYGTPWPEVDDRVLRPELADRLGCEDRPSLLAFGPGERAGRLAISPRDFARFGQLYLDRGRWQGTPLLREDLAEQAVRTPLPAAFPRAWDAAAPMLPGQRTLGSQKVPDNQTGHFGSYSFLWWVNGREQSGQRHWPAAPADTFAALGHGGKRGVAVLPSLELVVSWNDSAIDHPTKENEAFGLLVRAVSTAASSVPERRRVLIETDAGGDPDDEQSLVRFLLYANEWDVEGIIANRPQTRDGENRNPERTGLGVVRRLVAAYGDCWPHLVQNDPRYPTAAFLHARTVPGHNDTEEAVRRILEVVDHPDPRPVWYSDWGSDRGSGTNNLRRALDQVWRERGPAGYATFKSRLRLVSFDNFADHTSQLTPPFPLWVDTWRPELEGRRWYHRFSALTSTAGGFDIVRDCLTGHGPLGALYPANTTHPQKEGDTLSFLYLVPNGLNEPGEPGWGGWGGRLGLNPAFPGRSYYWASLADTWQGSSHRDNTLRRWAEAIQNDFKARLDWCVAPPAAANHPPIVRVSLPAGSPLPPGAAIRLDAGRSADPDGDRLRFDWFLYPEAGTCPTPPELQAEGSLAELRIPAPSGPGTHHVILAVTDSGIPPLTRYQRLRLPVAAAGR